MTKHHSKKISFTGVGVFLILLLIVSVVFGIVYFDGYRTTQEADLIIDRTWLILIIVETIAIVIVFIGNDRRIRYL